LAHSDSRESGLDLVYKESHFPPNFQKKHVMSIISSSSGGTAHNRRQGLLWLGTIPDPDRTWTPCLPDGIQYIRGQLEQGEGGLIHWQVFFCFSTKKSLGQVRGTWSPLVGHWELTRSAAAEEYVWKLDTRIGEPFEFGTRRFRRNSPTDWALVRQNAELGNFNDIPPDLYIRYYGNITKICASSLQPIAMERSCKVYWGGTNLGKSFRSWNEAGLDAYSKDPRTKFWDGYSNQDHVVLDEFRGTIDVSHLLRWLDRYPVRVEVKGSSVPLSATKFWITSNLPPSAWYPELDAATYAALERRLEIIEITSRDQ